MVGRVARGLVGVDSEGEVWGIRIIELVGVG